MFYAGLSKDLMDKRLPLTNSIMSDYLVCARRAYWQLVKGFEKPQTEAMSVGHAFHKGMEKRDPKAAVEALGLEYATDQAEYDRQMILKTTVEHLVRHALKNWSLDDYEQVIPELEFALPIRNPKTGSMSRRFYLAGKLDGLVRSEKGWWLNEYKTTGQSVNRAYVDRLDLDLQVTTYWFAGQEYLMEHFNEGLEGILYRVARKPSIRPRKNEALKEFLDRLINDFQERTDFYFKEIFVPRSQRHLEDFHKHLWDTAQLINYSLREDLWPMNTQACNDYGQCAFKPLCMRRDDAEYLYKKGGPTAELEFNMEGVDWFE